MFFPIKMYGIEIFLAYFDHIHMLKLILNIPLNYQLILSNSQDAFLPMVLLEGCNREITIQGCV